MRITLKRWDDDEWMFRVSAGERRTASGGRTGLFQVAVRDRYRARAVLRALRIMARPKFARLVYGSWKRRRA